MLDITSIDDFVAAAEATVSAGANRRRRVCQLIDGYFANSRASFRLTTDNPHPMVLAVDCVRMDLAAVLAGDMFGEVHSSGEAFSLSFSLGEVSSKTRSVDVLVRIYNPPSTAQGRQALLRETALCLQQFSAMARANPEPATPVDVIRNLVSKQAPEEVTISRHLAQFDKLLAADLSEYDLTPGPLVTLAQYLSLAVAQEKAKRDNAFVMAALAEAMASRPVGTTI